jgi:translation initiation factor IF-3
VNNCGLICVLTNQFFSAKKAQNVLEVFYIKQELPINEQIRAREVQLIDEQGEKKGVMKLEEALDLAYDKKLDLVLVAPNAQPPVCKIMNYGKYKFEQAKREKEAKKKQKVFEVKEIRITPNIEQHDFEFKVKNARKFIEDGNKVKITVRFRGRELNYVKLGEDNLNKFIEALSDVASPEKKAILEGKNMFIILAKKADK